MQDYFLGFVIQRNFILSQTRENSAHQVPKLLIGRTVLLIEDDEVNQILLTRMIHDQGGFSHLVTDKDQALEEIKSLKPHLVIVDISLQGIKSLDYVRVLKSLTTGKRTDNGNHLHQLPGKSHVSGIGWSDAQTYRL